MITLLTLCDLFNEIFKTYSVSEHIFYTQKYKLIQNKFPYSALSKSNLIRKLYPSYEIFSTDIINFEHKNRKFCCWRNISFLMNFQDFFGCLFLSLFVAAFEFNMVKYMCFFILRYLLILWLYKGQMESKCLILYPPPLPLQSLNR